MFSALSQGSLIHILDKTDGLKYKIGEVIGVTQPNQFSGVYGASSFTNPNSLIKLKVKVDGDVREYPEIPSANTVMSYNNGQIVLSETPQGIQTEVENIHNRHNYTLSNLDKIRAEKEECENIMKKLNPQFAKDKERDDRINGLDEKVTNMEAKLDKILNAVTTKSN